MTDIIYWLRGLAEKRLKAFGPEGADGCRYEEAAAEIERLRAEVTSKSEQIGKLYTICNEKSVLINERDKLRAAGWAVVRDYPVAAGTLKSPGADHEEDLGYGSIKALRHALEQSVGSRQP